MNCIRTLKISIILLLISFNYLDGQLLSWSNFRPKDTCGLKCLNGEILMKKKIPDPWTYGCGTNNVNIEFENFYAKELDDCCIEHDLCYENCVDSKSSCDTKFENCLNEKKESLPSRNNWNLFQRLALRAVIKVMKSAVKNFGCNSYKNANIRACQCV